MKKYLSIVLALCLAMTLFVFPTAVSAADEAVTVGFVAYKGEDVVSETNKVYPGDTITVNLVATATAEFTATESSVYFTYDTTKLTMAESTDEELAEKTAGEVSYSSNVSQAISVSGTILATITFTVNTTATGSVTLAIANDYTDFMVDSLTPATATAENLAITISASSGKAQILIEGSYQDITNNATYTDPESITVKAAVEGTATVKLEKVGEEANSELADFIANADYVISEGGQYIMTITPVGGTVTSVTFNYGQYAVDAKLSITAPTEEAALADYNDGYEIGKTFSLPVVINGLGEAKASMVKFSVTYNADVLTLTVPEDGNSEYTGEAGSYTVTYNPNVQDETLALANAATVESLGFTVAAGAANGTTDVTIDALDLALVTTVVDATTPSIGEQDTTVGVTVVPTGDFATVTTTTPDGYVKDAYVVEFTLVDEAEAKVLQSATQVADPIASYATITETVTNSFTVNAEGYYYLITKIGSNPAVYKSTEVVSKLDKTAPTLGTITTSNNGVWTNTGVTVTIEGTEDNLSGLDGYIYSTTSAEAGFTTEAVDSITIAATESVEKIWVKAVDNVGIESAATEVSVKQDGKKPEVSVTLANTNELTVTVTDDLSGIKSVVVKGGTADADITANVTAGEAYVYTATTSGNYTMVVTDNAGNETTSDEVVVSLVQATAMPIKVAINKDAETATTLNGFKADVDNGTFTYVKIEKGADETEGFTTKITIAKGTDEATEITTFPHVIDAVAGEYTLVVTTTSNTDANNKASATYTFKVSATQASMRSVDEDAIFNAFDYAHLRRLNSAGLNEADAYFTGGRLSADVTADMTLNMDDADAVLNAMRAVEYRGIYTFNIMNDITDDGATLE